MKKNGNSFLLKKSSILINVEAKIEVSPRALLRPGAPANGVTPT